MANGLVVADTGISVGGRAVLGANLGRVQVGMITHTSDTALATQASGGSQIGSAVSMTVPTSGQIRVTVLVIELDETEGSASGHVGIGLKIGGDAISWSVGDNESGNQEFTEIGNLSASVASGINGPGGFVGGQGSINYPAVHTWDVDDLGSVDGVQDVEVWLGDNVNSSTGEITVTGSTKTARLLVEIIDGT